MGIRVHKVIGYGLTNVQTSDYQIIDKRINSNSPFLTYTAGAWTDYRDWLRADASREDGESRLLESLFAQDKRKAPSPSSHVIHQAEFGLPNVLCIVPLWMPDWYRSDDMIDWIEETSLKSSKHAQMNHVKVLKHGIYPFGGNYMDARTGEPISNPVITWWRLQQGQSRSSEEIAMLDAVAQDLGFADHTEAKRFIVPTVPMEVRNLAEWGGLFTDDNVWKQLRPLHYVYWA